MSEPRRGHVVLVRFPFTDLRATKLRPAVVLARHGEDVVVVGVFSKMPPSPRATWLLIEESHPQFAATGLKRRSVVKGEKLAVVHRSVIVSTIGALPSDLLEGALHRVKLALEIP